MQKIRKMIQEALGVQNELNKLAPLVTKEIIEELLSKRDKIKIHIESGNIRPFKRVLDMSTPFEIKGKTFINSLTIGVEYTYSDINTIPTASGYTNPTGFEMQGENSYDVELTVMITSNVIEGEELFKVIEHVVSHELNHILREIRIANKSNRANLLNTVNNNILHYNNDFIESYPPLKEFFLMFYLSFPHEINARVQETATNLKYIKSTTKDDILNELLRYNPLRYSREMMHYELSNIKKLDQKTLVKFLAIFNSYLIKYTPKEMNPKQIDDVDKFFEYWLPIIHSSGHKLMIKIERLVWHKISGGEDDYGKLVSESFYNKMTGKIFNPS